MDIVNLKKKKKSGKIEVTQRRVKIILRALLEVPV